MIVLGAVLGDLIGLVLAVAAVNLHHHVHRYDVRPYSMPLALNVTEAAVLVAGSALLGAWLLS